MCDLGIPPHSPYDRNRKVDVKFGVDMIGNFVKVESRIFPNKVNGVIEDVWRYLGNPASS
jgi:hypothetical protein